MIQALSKQIPGVDSTKRLFCAGHIINLVVKAILFGEGISRFERDLIGASDQETFELWRKFGVIGKVHNIVKYIMRSDQRRQELEKHLKQIIKESQQKTSEVTENLIDSVLTLIKDGGGKQVLNKIY